MSKKILNTVRGCGANTIERAGLITLREIRERQQANRVSWVIKTDPYFFKKDDNRVKRTHRTMLWP